MEPASRRTLIAVNKLEDFFILWKTSQGFLGEAQPTVNGELKDTVTAGDQGEGGYPISIPLKDFLRQTGGPGKIVSLNAVFQTDLHYSSLLISACTAIEPARS